MYLPVWVTKRKVLYILMLTSWAASIDIKSKAPNGVTFNVNGKASHEGKNAGKVYSNTLRIL